MFSSRKNGFTFKYITIKLMLLIFKVIGLAPYGTRKFPTSIRLKKGTKQISPPVQFSTSNLGCFYNLILLFAQIYMLTLSIPLLEEMDYPEQSDLTVIIEEVESVFGNLFLFCIWLIIGFRQKTAVKLINRLLSVDNRTVSCNSNYFTDSSGNFFAISFAVNIAVSVGLVVTEMIAYNIFVLTLFAVMLTSFILAWFTIQYVFVIKLIENRFKGLNRALRDHLALSCSSDFRLAQLFSVRAATIKYSRELRIFTIRKAHMNLCEISDEIAEFYSFPILLTIAYASFTIIYNAYYLVIACILSDDNLNEFVIINAILWLASHMIPLAMLAATVDNISRELRTTVNIVRNHLLGSNINQHDVIELKEFGIELMHRKVRFSACDMFPLDYTLAASIFSMVITYLVILIQFQMAQRW